MLMFCLFVVFLTLLLHIGLMDRELPAPFYIKGRYDIWCVHHDEKLVIPDARWLHLKQREKKIAFIEDYKPWSVLSVFGLLGPCLPAWGFRLMGFNNKGLRLPALIVGTLFNLFTAMLAWKLLDPWSTLAVTLLVCLNYQFFVLHHHYILENILGAAILVVLWLFAVNPVQFAENIFPVVFACSALSLIKLNFPVTLWVLAGCLLMVEGATVKTWIDMAMGIVCGFMVFEGLQFAVTRRLGIASWRWINLIKTLQVHNGKEHDFLQKHFKPVGWRLFVRFPLLVVDWFFLTTSRNILPTKPIALAIAAVFWAVMAIVLQTNDPAITGIVFFTTVMLIVGTPFFYYPKRVAPLLAPISLVFFKAVQPLTTQFPSAFWMVLIAAGLILAVHTYQVAFSQSDRGVKERSRDVKALIPAGSTIYMQCYPFRFSWQIDTCRLISGDDQCLDNQRILDMALADENTYFMLEDLPPDLLWKLERTHSKLATFHCPMNQCDLPKNFYLFQQR